MGITSRKLKNSKKYKPYKLKTHVKVKIQSR